MAGDAVNAGDSGDAGDAGTSAPPLLARSGEPLAPSSAAHSTASGRGIVSPRNRIAA